MGFHSLLRTGFGSLLKNEYLVTPHPREAERGYASVSNEAAHVEKTLTARSEHRGSCRVDSLFSCVLRWVVPKRVLSGLFALLTPINFATSGEAVRVIQTTSGVIISHDSTPDSERARPTPPDLKKDLDKFNADVAAWNARCRITRSEKEAAWCKKERTRIDARKARLIAQGAVRN